MEYPYLIAIALIKEKGKRAMPIGGKSIKSKISQEEYTRDNGKVIALELLLRVIQRTENNPIERDASENSLLLIEISMENMQFKLPNLKSEWINTGNLESFISQLKEISKNVWAINFIKHEGIKFEPIQ